MAAAMAAGLTDFGRKVDTPYPGFFDNKAFRRFHLSPR
jgi:hypothetical protein